MIHIFSFSVYFSFLRMYLGKSEYILTKISTNWATSDNIDLQMIHFLCFLIFFPSIYLEKSVQFARNPFKLSKIWRYRAPDNPLFFIVSFLLTIYLAKSEQLPQNQKEFLDHSTILTEQKNEKYEKICQLERRKQVIFSKCLIY